MSSSRRTGGEINILAMLEGQSGKPLSRRLRRWSRAAWYGGSGLLACGLLGALAWVALDPAGGGFEGRVVAGTPAPVKVIEPLPVPMSVPEGLPNPALHVDQAPAHGAAIVDVAMTDGVPPPHDGRRAASVAAVVPMPAAAAAPVPVEVAASVPARVPAAAPTPQAAPHAVTRPVAKATPAARAAAAPVHARRAAPPVKPDKPGQATVDTDVALISAIILHANKRADGKDDKPAMPHPTAQP